MQPVLDRARNILEGGDDPGMDLPDAAGSIETGRDSTLIGAAFEHDDEPPTPEPAPLVSRQDVIEWLKGLASLPDCSVEIENEDLIKVSLAGFGLLNFGITSGSLDRNPKSLSLALPPIGRSDWLDELNQFFQSQEARVPLVLASAEMESFKCVELAFIDSRGVMTSIRDMAQLRTQLAAWDGLFAEENICNEKTELLKKACEDRVRTYAKCAADASRLGLRRMRQAALRRLLLQVGVLLSILDGNSDDLNGSWYRQLNAGTGVGVSLQLSKARAYFNGWPDWEVEYPGLQLEVRRALDGLESKRETSLRSGSALKAALEDPRLQIKA